MSRRRLWIRERVRRRSSCLRFLGAWGVLCVWVLACVAAGQAATSGAGPSVSFPHAGLLVFACSGCPGAETDSRLFTVRPIAFTEEYDCACGLGLPYGSYMAVGVVNADGSGLNKYGGGFRLLTKDGFSSNPSWSPDGKRITYDSGDPHQQIHVMDATGKHKLRLTTARASSFEPDWSLVR